MTTPVTGFNAKTELLNQIFLVANANNALDTLKAQQNEVWCLVLAVRPGTRNRRRYNDIYGGAARDAAIRTLPRRSA